MDCFEKSGIDFLAALLEDLGLYTSEKKTIYRGFKVKEGKDSYTYELVLPGLSRDDVELMVKTREGYILNVNVKKDSVFYEKGERELALPKDIDSENISSILKDGVLTITFKKIEATKRDIKIDTI
jgi:HSP20 family molecular chaperone IbpA